ncbi:MAG: hypothetical protein HYV04_00550 [Deltaproteobacteria bacterium]|nr:hypothetical protein [Deltaproteobacteria bacterium]
MADQKKESLEKAPVEELKWWIDRGPVKEREKRTQLGRGIIEKRVYEMLKDYSQEQAVRNVVDINTKLLKEHDPAPSQWKYHSLGVGTYPGKRLNKIKAMLQLPPGARGLLIDAGYSLRALITGDPVGETLVDINFTEAPSVDYWVGGELVEERLFPNLDEALKKLQRSLARYLNPPDSTGQ